MPQDDQVEAAREMYRAFAAGDRDTVERLLSYDFTFSSPPDPTLDRAGYFERCWPGAGQEVIVTYEMTDREGRRGRNTEVLTFSGEQICRAEVYFGWNVE